MVKIKTSNNLLRQESINSSSNLSSAREDRILIEGKFYPVTENIINETFII
jgi:hypothetical protein